MTRNIILKKYGFSWLYRDFFCMRQYFWPHTAQQAHNVETTLYSYVESTLILSFHVEFGFNK